MQIPKNLHILSTGKWHLLTTMARAQNLVNTLTEKPFVLAHVDDTIHLLFTDGEVTIAKREENLSAYKQFIPEWIPMSEYLRDVHKSMHKKNQECKNLRIRLKALEH